MSSNSLLDVQEMQWTLSQDPQELHNDAEAEILPMQKLLVRSISNLSIDRMRRSSRRGSIQSDCSDESLGLSGHSTSPYFGQSLSPCEDVSRSISGCADYSDANTLAPSAYVRRSPNECIRRSPRDYLRPSDFQQPQAEVQQDVQSIPGQEDRPLRNDSQLEEDSTSQNSMLLSIRNISIHRISRESSLQSDYSEPPSGRPRDGIRRVPSDAIPRRRSTCSGYLDNEYSGPSGCMRRRSSMQSESDLQVWWKLFCFLDDDGSSSITQDAVHQKLSQMVGECEWADENGNDAMEFDEFVQCMTDLPLSKKHACLAWAREYCEDQTRGQPVPPIGPQYEAPHWAADKSLMAPHVFDKQVSEEDLAAWKRLYDFVDEDKNGLITQREITDKMSHMVGPFDWEDVNADGAMDFHEFVSCMLALPKSKRFTCLLWAMHECPTSQLLQTEVDELQPNLEQSDNESEQEEEPQPVRHESSVEGRSPSQRSMVQSIRNLSIHRIRRESSMQSDYSEPPSGRSTECIRRVPSDSARCRRSSICSDYLDADYSGPAGCMHRRGSTQSDNGTHGKQVSEEDLAAWKRLYDFVDEDKNGLITQREISDKMSHMVGPFDWEDVNADGAMDFHEFVSCMLALPKSKRFTCLLWAMHECPN